MGQRCLNHLPSTSQGHRCLPSLWLCHLPRGIQVPGFIFNKLGQNGTSRRVAHRGVIRAGLGGRTSLPVASHWWEPSPSPSWAPAMGPGRRGNGLMNSRPGPALPPIRLEKEPSNRCVGAGASWLGAWAGVIITQCRYPRKTFKYPFEANWSCQA